MYCCNIQVVQDGYPIIGYCSKLVWSTQNIQILIFTKLVRIFWSRVKFVQRVVTVHIIYYISDILKKFHWKFWDGYLSYRLLLKTNGSSNEKFIKLAMTFWWEKLKRKRDDAFFNRCHLYFASVTSFFELRFEFRFLWNRILIEFNFNLINI
jgi:hypothetical protein